MISISVYGAMTVKVVCGSCSGSIQSSFKVDKNSITTGNTTERAAYHLEAHERDVRARMQRELWNDEMCGRCRIDAAERARTSQPSSNTQEPK